MNEPGDRYRIFVGPGSPYSHKMWAVMRYRRIPHEVEVCASPANGALFCHDLV
jgi:hypothetical protein